MDTFYDEKKDSRTSDIIYIGLTALMVFGLVYVAGRAWKSSQSA